LELAQNNPVRFVTVNYLLAEGSASDIYVQLHAMIPGKRCWATVDSNDDALTEKINNSTVYEAVEVRELLRCHQDFEKRKNLFADINMLAFIFISVPRISNNPFLPIVGQT
jgi:hypothetical protein